MSLSSSVTDLATRIASYIKTSVLPRLLPADGAAGQVLAKSAAADYSVGWVQGWTSANFNPSSYAPIASPALTGTATAVDMNFSGFVGFGGSYRQMLNLSGASYGLGTQTNSLYVRTGGEFAVHVAGTHSDTQGDAGSGGANLMRINYNLFTYRGNNIWHAGNSSISSAANGYCKLPNGLIMQWGMIPIGSGSDPGVTFPTAFPNACFSVAASSEFTDGASSYVVHTSNVSTTGFTARRRRVQGMTFVSETSSGTRWIAIGN